MHIVFKQNHRELDIKSMKTKHAAETIYRKMTMHEIFPSIHQHGYGNDCQFTL